jgi:sigma-E factor negative regulatory protein RseB
MRAVDLGRRCGLRQAAGAGLALGTSSWLTHAWAGTKDSVPLNDPAALMRWVQGAMTQRSFSGTYVVSAGGSMSSSRIVHICDGRTQVERIESLDGRARQIYRHNETVHVFWPDTKEATVEQRDFIRRFPLTGQGDSVPPLDMYELNDRGQERLAGQDAWVLNFKARDNLRFAQRWWVDKRTGLLLRADTYGANGDVVESAAFSEIQVGTKQVAQQLIQEMNRLDGFRVRRPVTTSTDLESEGWSMGNVAAGFRPVSTVRRQRFPDVRPATEAPSASNSLAPGVNASAATGTSASAGAGAATMLQTIYSDGLTHVSVFIEPYAARPRKGERLVSTGATHALTRRLGDWWVTVVGDVPGDTLGLFATALERRRP